MMKSKQLFSILHNDKYFLSLEKDGTFLLGKDNYAKLDIVELEEWLTILNFFKITYKVKAIQTIW